MPIDVAARVIANRPLSSDYNVLALAAPEIDAHQLGPDLLGKQRREHGQGRAVRFPVVQGHAHVRCPGPMCGCSRIVTRLTMLVRPMAQHALVAGRA